MLVHIYTRMGKCHCVDVTGIVVLSDATLYIECLDCTYELIKHEEPCCICLMDIAKQITLHGCTINNKTITYADRHVIGRSNK